MKQYNFTQEGIDNFYNDICNKSTDNIHKAMVIVENSRQLQITKEENDLIEELYKEVEIKIFVADMQINIPNNADFIEMLVGYIKECKESEYI